MLFNCHLTYVGVCREGCTPTGIASTCSITRDVVCTVDGDCPGTAFCYNSYCQEGCTRGDDQCSTSGFTCQQDVCLKVCDETGLCGTCISAYRIY